ncbi:hypothetical protein [Shewanella violacea]|uniref:DUF3379 domain-containing protein n=1 Tax=Shewanella violacea (strain JCM 10179 / CIP 106290 / LMG 19151 / DSS12) TaxID=637905 RepID=D4ZF35_SHEVD|nr:hypothetical protein [Shewanella violacea]BAJ04199.1 hypothetical protein SVI_4228 [Shewanella violacea DSS12]
MSNLGSGNMNTGFKQAVKLYIESESLDDEQLAKFERLLGEDFEEAVPKVDHDSTHLQNIDDKVLQHELASRRLKASRGKYSLLALTASLLLVFILSVNIYPASQDMSWKIADEVAMNHIKMKPLELKSAQLAPLRDYFTQLDFSVVDSDLFAKQENSMLGGRYCSIQGVTAAQIRYQTDKGKKVTLYEVGYNPKLYGEIPKIEKGEVPLSITVKGVKVSLWVEKGLLMAEARSLD